MPKITEQPRRKRGVVLSVQGWQRLDAAKQKSEIQENSGNSYTLEDLSIRTQLSPNTLTRVQRRKVPVDRYTLERYFSAFNLTLSPQDYTQLDSDIMPTQMSLEFPSGPVPINSPFYINRPPIEELTYQEISKPGSVIEIKAPRKMGKSSLLIRIIAHAIQVGYKTVSLDFQEADDAIFYSLNKFLRWFCANISRQLNLKPLLDDYWDEDMGSKVSCTIYFEGYLLEQIDCPVVLALNEVNRVFEHPNIAQDFLPLLRFWHEQAKQVETFQKLRLVVV
ncbi:MAG TPA: AAA-like domain-containing protein, partial [Oculatellaceae cyanobacterium]